MKLKTTGALFFLFAFQSFSHADAASLTYLKKTSIDVVNEVPPAPATGSAVDRQDVTELLRLQNTRTDEDCARANSEVRISVNSFFGPKYGPLSAREAAATEDFLMDVAYDANYFSRQTKKIYERPRPYDHDSRLNPCLPRESSFAYPSGHSTEAYTMGLVLAALDPTRADAFKKRAHEIAFDRVLGGVHHPSDIVAARGLADLVFQRLMEKNSFVDDLHDAATRVLNVYPESRHAFEFLTP